MKPSNPFLVFTALSISILHAEIYVCQKEVPAYDPLNPKNQIGTFAPKTNLEITSPETSDEMLQVTFKSAKGEVIQAVCKKADLYPTATLTPVPAKPDHEKIQNADTSEWITDYKKAVEIAKKENKKILLDFTGSDWCGFCKRLDHEVFDSQTFKDFAKNKFVLVTIDFPHHKAISPMLKAQNLRLKEEYEVRGYPTVLILDSNGKKVGKIVGYSKAGPEAYMDHLKESLTSTNLKKENRSNEAL